MPAPKQATGRNLGIGIIGTGRILRPRQLCIGQIHTA